MKNPIVTINLNEYNGLIEFKNKINEGLIYILHENYNHGACYSASVTYVSPSDAVRETKEAYDYLLNRKQDEVDALQRAMDNLTKEKETYKKSWFCKIFKK